MNDIYDQLLVKKDDLEIKFNDGIQLERQRIAANKIDFEIPSQYKELLLLSNGFAVLDYKGYRRQNDHGGQDMSAA